MGDSPGDEADSSQRLEVCRCLPSPANAAIIYRIATNCRKHTEVHGCFSSQSFWKRGSPRSGSNIGSSRSNAGVSGTLLASAPVYGIENSFCKAAMARSGSSVFAATRARISIGMAPSTPFSQLASRLWRAPPEPTQQPCHRGTH